MAKIVRTGEAIRITIVAYTMAPIRAMALAQLNMTGDMRHSLDDVPYVEAADIFRDICKTELQGAFEFAHFNIQMEGVSRAFQQQLTRTRLASYSAESLRFTEVGMQVLAGPYLMEMHDEFVKDMPAAELCDVPGDPLFPFYDACNTIENAYSAMIEMGVPIEDARGILPLNVLSKIGMSISYKTLVHMSRVRLCYQSQKGEWGPVFGAIIDELAEIDPLLTLPMGPFCQHGQKCPFGSRLDRPCPINIRREDQ